MFGFGDETFWLNVVNAAFGIVTAAAIVAVLGSIAVEIWRRTRHAGRPAHERLRARGETSAVSRTS